MQQINPPFKIIIIVALAIFILGGIVYSMSVNTLTSTTSLLPSPATTSSTQVSELTTINDTSLLNADMNSYLKASDQAPNPNAFNDSYSDINQ